MQIESKAEFELVPRSEQSSFTLREFKLPAFSNPWHFHPEIEINYILQSQGRRFVGDHMGFFHPGDLVLVGANLPHVWLNNTVACGAETFAHSLVIQFHQDCLGPDFFSLPEMAGIRKLLHTAKRGLQFTGRTRDAVAAIMLEMRKHGEMAQLIDLLSILQLLTQAEAPTPLSSAGFTPLLDELASQRIKLAYQYVFKYFGEPLDYEEIAKKAGMSQSAFCRYFKRVTGRTLSDFVREVRLGHARRLLIETSEGIAQVAFASGFNNISNFNHQFYTVFGSSPSEYRRQHQRGRKNWFIREVHPENSSDVVLVNLGHQFKRDDLADQTKWYLQSNAHDKKETVTHRK
jgi:AraC-like DNA-binding protein